MARVVVLPELAQWRDEDNGEVCVAVRTDADPARAFAVMRDVVDELRDALSYPELSHAVPLPTGAGFFLGHTDDDYDEAYEITVGVTRRHFETAGLSGELHPYDTTADRDPVRTVPPIDFLHSFVCLPGRWVRPHWLAPVDVAQALVEFAVGWCQWGDVAADVHVDMTEAMGHTVNGGLARELLGLYVQHSHDPFRVTGVTKDGHFRHVVFSIEFGSIGLAVGTMGESVPAWRGAVDELRAALIAVAPHVVSAFIKRGRWLVETGSTQTLMTDWVPTPHVYTPLLSATPRLADRYVPDAFGVQLLGPGHRDRLPGSGRWTVREVPADRMLVEYDDLAAWYRDTQPAPEVLTEARAEFAGLLMRHDLFEWSRSRDGNPFATGELVTTLDERVNDGGTLQIEEEDLPPSEGR
jgi:hypothetical protein